MIYCRTCGRANCQLHTTSGAAAAHPSLDDPCTIGMAIRIAKEIVGEDRWNRRGRRLLRRFLAWYSHARWAIDSWAIDHGIKTGPWDGYMHEFRFAPLRRWFRGNGAYDPYDPNHALRR